MHKTVHDFTMHLQLICFQKCIVDIGKTTFSFLCLYWGTKIFKDRKKLVMNSSIVWRHTEVNYLALEIWPSMWFPCPVFKSVQCTSVRKCVLMRLGTEKKNTKGCILFVNSQSNMAKHRTNFYLKYKTILLSTSH